MPACSTDHAMSVFRGRVRLDFDCEKLARLGHGEHVAFVPQAGRPGPPPWRRVHSGEGIQPPGGQLGRAGFLFGLRIEGHDCLAVDHGEVGGREAADGSLDHAFLHVSASLHDLFDDHLKVGSTSAHRAANQSASCRFCHAGSQPLPGLANVAVALSANE